MSTTSLSHDGEITDCSPKTTVEPFPLDALPDVVRRYIDEAARAISCPPDFVAVPALAALGAAIGTSCRIEVKPGWEEFPCLWAAVVNAPGTAKSPALDKAVQPIYARQEKLDAQYLQQREKYSKHQDQAKPDTTSQRGTGKKNEKKENHEDRERTKRHPPTRQQAFVTDATVEALAEVLKENPRGALFVRDELTGWSRGMGQYKDRSADKQFWLSVWNGAPAIINRKNLKEPVHLPHPLVAVTGCLPPDVLADLTDQVGRSDGFLDRILFSYPNQRPRRWTDHGTDPAIAKDYQSLFERLYKIRRIVSLLHLKTVPKTLHLSPVARKEFGEFFDGIQAEMEEPDFPYWLRGPWAKMPGYCARLALIIHIVRRECGETDSKDIDETSLRAAMRLIDYFQSHARKVYAELHGYVRDDRHHRVLAWLQANRGIASARDMLTAKVAGCRTRNDLDELLRQLEQSGAVAIEQITPARGGRAKTIVRLANYSAAERRPSAERLQNEDHGPN